MLWLREVCSPAACSSWQTPQTTRKCPSDASEQSWTQVATGGTAPKVKGSKKETVTERQIFHQLSFSCSLRDYTGTKEPNTSSNWTWKQTVYSTSQIISCDIILLTQLEELQPCRLLSGEQALWGTKLKTNTSLTSSAAEMNVGGRCAPSWTWRQILCFLLYYSFIEH